MKNRIISGILFIILGGLIAFGPLTIFPVCGVHTTETTTTQGSMTMAGHTSIQSEGKMVMETGEGSGTQTSMAKSTVMKCHWTAQAELGIGILIALLGIFLLFSKSSDVRLGLSLALILYGLLVLLIPIALVGVCGSLNMSCRSLTLPALIILSSAVVFTAAANVYYLYHSRSKGLVKS
jgi:hypothetical protein